MIKVIQGDITKVKVDAIVNAANTSLLGGGGVDGAIHREGGNAILQDCIKIRDKQGGCQVGEAVITTAGNLPAKYVIHTVGPIWKGGSENEDKLLTNAYRNSLKIAIDNNIQSISFPNISTGVYNFPKDRAANIALSTVVDYLKDDKIIKDVFFVCFDKENFDIYNSLLNNDNIVLPNLTISVNKINDLNMTDQEKIIRHDTLEFLRQRIGGCFGTADGIFAGHPNDEERAKELRKLALNNKITLQEIRELTLGYLYGRGYIGDHIKEQLNEVTKMFGKKIQ